MPQIPKKLILFFIVFSFIGFLDAAYLTVQHYTQGILPCYVFKGCDLVTSSPYATIAGFPIALLGAFYYLTILLVSILFLDTSNTKLLRVLANLPILGFLVSLFLVYLQLFVIHAICFYCMTSAISSTLLFVFGYYIIRLKRKVGGRNNL